MEPPSEDLIAVVARNANVHTGPGTDNGGAFRLTDGAEVTALGLGYSPGRAWI